MCISAFPVVFFWSVPHRLHSVTSIVYLFLRFFHCNGLHGWIVPLSSHDFLGFPKETSLPLMEWFLPHADNVYNAYNYWVKQRRKYVFCRLKRGFKRLSWRADRLLHLHLRYHRNLVAYWRLWRQWVFQKSQHSAVLQVGTNVSYVLAAAIFTVEDTHNVFFWYVAIMWGPRWHSG